MNDVVVSDPLQTLAGRKQVTLLQRHLRQLRKAYAHGNRRLFYDELVTAYLLAFFNPTLRSLRVIDDFSSDPQRHPRRLCRSTMSDANALMDARLLEPIIRQLQARVPQLRRQDGQLHRLLEQVQLVDGSFFDAAATVTWALRDRKRTRDGQAVTHSHVRLDLRVSAWSLLPTHVQVNGKGRSEAAAACDAIQPGVIYVADRGLESFAYVRALLDANADFVLRLTGTPKFAAREDQPRDADDVTAGVLSDRIGRLVGSPHTRAAGTVPHEQELREVVVSAADPRNPDNPIRLLTSLIDVPAHVIALLYRHRWQIELFFRWLKVHAHFDHLISRSRNGMTLGFYVAIIAVLLMYLRTGRPMSKYAFNLLSYVAAAAGQGSIETTLAILERRERECECQRQRQRARRAAKTGM